MTVAIAAVRCDNDDILFILSHVPAIEKSASSRKIIQSATSHGKKSLIRKYSTNT